MGYDFEVRITKTLHDDNYTCNVSEMYYKSFNNIKDNFKELLNSSWKDINNFKDALTAEHNISTTIIKAMIDELKNHPETYKKLNPKNGWGDYDGAINFLNKTYSAMLISDDTYLVIS